LATEIFETNSTVNARYNLDIDRSTENLTVCQDYLKTPNWMHFLF
jgi:hypothetical protein